MKSFCCSNCGYRQKPKLGVNGKTSLDCKNCGKPLFAKRDRSGITVKVFDTDEPP